MSVEKHDHSISRWHTLNFFVLGGPFLGLIIATVAGWISPYVAIPVALPIALVGAFWQYRMFHHFRCPTCQTMLHRTIGKPDSKITFECRRCDTIWNTGMREGGDGDGDFDEIFGEDNKDK